MARQSEEGGPPDLRSRGKGVFSFFVLIGLPRCARDKASKTANHFFLPGLSSTTCISESSRAASAIDLSESEASWKAYL
jgi:hypothetical protein